MKTFVRGLAVGLLAANTFVLSVVNADEHALQEQVVHKIAAATIVVRGRQEVPAQQCAEKTPIPKAIGFANQRNWVKVAPTSPSSKGHS